MIHHKAAITLALVFLGLPTASYASKLYVANNGTDSNSCGAMAATACRSISQGIANAKAGDTIVVGPGTYGDLNGNGTLGETGEETGGGTCGCLLLVDKAVAVLSSDGEASTVIDAHTVTTSTSVDIKASGAHFGGPSQGFTITKGNDGNTLDQDESNGIVIEADKVTIAGNRVIYSAGTEVSPLRSFGDGIETNKAALIEGNEVRGWGAGIVAGRSSQGDPASGAMVTGNAVTSNLLGIFTDATVTGNVIADNGTGIASFPYSTGNPDSKITGNSVLGNTVGVDATFGVGALENNNIFGNGCGLQIQNTTPALATKVLAINNYWGASTGPGADPADNVCGANAGDATVNPFATVPFKLKLSTTLGNEQ